MNASRPAHNADSAAQPAPVKTRSRFNAYPLLGILLVIVLAALAYGGLYFLFCN